MLDFIIINNNTALNTEARGEGSSDAETNMQIDFEISNVEMLKKQYPNEPSL